MKIAVDLDNVLVEITDLLLEIANRDYNVHVTRKDINRWKSWNSFGIYEKEFSAMLDECAEKYLTLPIVDEDAPEYMRIMNRYDNIDIVTARNKDQNLLITVKLTMLGIYPKTHYNEIVTVGRNGNKSKLDYDLYIDDSPILAEELIGTKKTLFLYNANWNQYFNDDKYLNITRVNGWKDLYKKYVKFAMKKEVLNLIKELEERL